jgi:transcription elongation factor Elf1
MASWRPATQWYPLSEKKKKMLGITSCSSCSNHFLQSLKQLGQQDHAIVSNYRIHTHTYTQKERERERETDRQTDRQTERQGNSVYMIIMIII